MRRSASRRSRTLLLKARPPAMTSPPAMKTAEPSRGCGGRQGAACRVADSRVVLLLLVARHEGEPAREAVHDEVVSRGVDAAVHERREQNKQSEDEGRPRAHRDVPPWSWPRRNSSTLPSQLRPSNARLESVTRSTSSRQRALTSIESGRERGTQKLATPQCPQKWCWAIPVLKRYVTRSSSPASSRKDSRGTIQCR